MSKTVNAGIVTAYGAAVRGGYEGTYAQFCADLGKLADVLSEFLGFSVSIETLAEGEPATANYDGGILSLGIPRGSTGNGIQSIVLNEDYTLTVTYTNGNHWTSGSIRGQVGATPHLTIGTVQTLEPGQSATAEITGTDEDPVLNFGIPKGQAGASDAGGVSYDTEGSYDEGTVGKELQEQTRHLSDLDECCAEVNEQLETLVKLDSDEAHKYGCLWNQVDNTMQRIWDSDYITTDTSKFTYNGSVNENYNNPFDERYPWSGRKCCNIDLAAYMAMHTAGAGNLTDCVTYWEDEAGFDWDDPDGVWVYTPEFWFTIYDREDGQRVFGVADSNIPGWIYAPESIRGRMWGIDEVRSIDGEDTHIFLPKAGMPMRNISSVIMHDYAKNMKASLSDLYTQGAENMLYIVEFANMNSQDALGQGGVLLYRQSSDKIQKAAENTNVVQVNTNAIGNYFPVGAIMDIGTASGGLQIASRMVVSTEVDEEDATKTNVTLAGDPVTVTTSHFWSIHSRGNIEGLESAIGSHSGYIGTNGYVNAWYRGRVSHGNLWDYCLGLFHQKTTRHVWYADVEDLDDYDAIDTSVHHDSGIAVATSDNFVNKLGLIPGVGQLGICTQVGGNGTKPVGDYHYQANADTVFRFGGSSITASSAARFGRFIGFSYSAASYAYWSYSAVPRLKAP